MTKSVIFYLDRNNILQVIDEEELRHYDEKPPIFDIVKAVINAGYKGVVIDANNLDNGRIIRAISTNLNSPEGQIISNLASAENQDKPLPSIEIVLNNIKKQYDELGEYYE